MSRPHGFALVLALWVLAMLGALAMGYSSASRTEVLLTRHAVDAAHLRAAAEAGVTLAVMGLTHPDARERWRSDGTPQDARFDGMDLRVAAFDETGRIDLNETQDEIIQAALGHAGVPGARRDEILSAMLDFRDEDHARRLTGLEDDDYRALGLPYGAKDGPFEDVEELRLVPGITPEVFGRLRPLLTIHSGSARVNPAVASRAVLLSLPGAIEANVDAYLAERMANALDPTLPAPRSPFGVDERYLSHAPGETHVIRVEASSQGVGLLRVEAVIRLHWPWGQGSVRPYDVLSWEEGARFELPLPMVGASGARDGH